MSAAVDELAGGTLPEAIQMMLESEQFFLDEDIYPDDIRSMALRDLARLEDLQHQKSFNRDDVLFLLHQFGLRVEMDTRCEIQLEQEQQAPAALN